MLIESCYYKAHYENRKWPWQKGYISWKIAQQERGGHSHEELLIRHPVLEEYVRRAPKMRKVMMAHPILSVALRDGKDVCASSSSRDGGVRFKLAEQVLKNEHKWDIIPTTDDMEKALVMFSFFRQEDGKDYDFAGVGGFKLSVLSENPSKWYCTEICDKAKQLAGLWMQFYRSHPSASYWIQVFLAKHGIA